MFDLTVLSASAARLTQAMVTLETVTVELVAALLAVPASLHADELLVAALFADERRHDARGRRRGGRLCRRGDRRLGALRRSAGWGLLWHRGTPSPLYTVPVTQPGTAEADDPAVKWLDALEGRYLADLRPAEVGRALRALSSAYVERRDRLARGAALDGAGKRAAFALFYGPLHFLIVRAIVRGLGAAAPPVELIADLGCGTGVAGAAWALECAPHPGVFGIERHPWAADEARWTCRTLGLDAEVRCGDLARVRIPARASAVVAAYTANELADDARAVLLREPIAIQLFEKNGTRGAWLCVPMAQVSATVFLTASAACVSGAKYSMICPQHETTRSWLSV